jgi:hypothetical protein
VALAVAVAAAAEEDAPGLKKPAATAEVVMRSLAEVDFRRPSCGWEGG